MMLNKTAIKKLNRLMLSAVSAALVVLLASCGSGGAAGVRIIKDVTERNNISYKAQNDYYHYCAERSKLGGAYASSGLIKMFVDDVSDSFCIVETSQDYAWSALPEDTDADALPANLGTSAAGENSVSSASMVSLKVAGGTDVYYLNSQDNSVAFGKSSVKKTESGAEFTYKLFTTEEVASKSKLSADDIAFEVKLSVTLEDGSMFVTCTHSNLSGNPDAYIEDIELLNFFGAYNQAVSDDFVLVPDGCGAIIKTAVSDDSFEPLSFKVYGADPALGESVSAGNSAVVAAFGMKHASSAFVALVEKGDAVASIKADKAVAAGEYNRAYASFNITPVVYSDEKLYISTSGYADEISMCYRFVSGKNATYAGLAGACREQLIRNSTLATGNITKTDALPFNLTVTGAVQKKLVGSTFYTEKVTDFDQARDMLTRMKSKGINSVNLRFTGAGSGGDNSKDICSANLLSRLGGSSGLEALYNYTSTQNMGLYLDVNLLTSSSGFTAGQSGIKNIYKASGAATFGSTISGNGTYTRALRSLSKFGNVISDTLSNNRYLSFTGFCINDAGSLLYSDYSGGGINRVEAAAAVSSQLTPLATNRLAMAVGGNFYMLRDINTIVSMPIDTSVTPSGAYMSVPFIQLILHGIADYSGAPINTLLNAEETLLRCAEYGACPHYQWNYSSSTEDVTADIYYCDNTINEAVEIYQALDGVLHDLRSSRITDHYEVSDGVFCTEYDTGAVIYVNYTGSDYTVHGVVVEARNFMRVN